MKALFCCCFFPEMHGPLLAHCFGSFPKLSSSQMPAATLKALVSKAAAEAETLKATRLKFLWREAWQASYRAWYFNSIGPPRHREMSSILKYRMGSCRRLFAAMEGVSISGPGVGAERGGERGVYNVFLLFDVRVSCSCKDALRAKCGKAAED